MAMEFYYKDLYGPSGGYVQTTEQTVPDGNDNAEIVEDAKAASAADNVKGKASGKKIFAAILVFVCLAILLGGRK